LGEHEVVDGADVQRGERGAYRAYLLFDEAACDRDMLSDGEIRERALLTQVDLVPHDERCNRGIIVLGLERRDNAIVTQQLEQRQESAAPIAWIAAQPAPPPPRFEKVVDAPLVEVRDRPAIIDDPSRERTDCPKLLSDRARPVRQLGKMSAEPVDVITERTRLE
jgi:hypothetical protein